MLVGVESRVLLLCVTTELHSRPTGGNFKVKERTVEGWRNGPGSKVFVNSMISTHMKAMVAHTCNSRTGSKETGISGAVWPGSFISETKWMMPEE